MTPPAEVLVLLVTGSREWSDAWALKQKLDQVADDAAEYAAEHDLDVTLLVRHGACYPKRDRRTGRIPARSADWLTQRWITDFSHPLRVIADPMPADWTGPCRPSCATPRPPKRDHRYVRGDGVTICPAAGNYRNQDMIDKQPRPDLAVAFLLNGSPGTRDCIRRLEDAGLAVDTVERGTPPPRRKAPARR